MPVSLNGSYERELTRNRLVVVGHVFELGNKNLTLQLDSGTPSIVLFTTFSTSTQVSGASSSYSLGSVFGGGSSVDPQKAHFLRLGEKLFTELTVFVRTGKAQPTDVDGLLPTALFRSIFISHSGRFVILNPSVKEPALAQSQSTFRRDTGIAVAQSMRKESPE